MRATRVRRLTPTIAYNVGNFRVTLGPPRIAYQGSPGEYCWFSGMNKFPSGEILLRMNAHPDTGVGDGTTRHILSLDGGFSFDVATIYDIAGGHTSNEPMYMETTGQLRGGDYGRFTRTSLRSFTCAYQSITNGGRTYVVTPNGCTISGFTRDVGDLSVGVPGVAWFGDIVRISDAQWLSILPTWYATAGVNDGYYTGTIIESADRGVTWTAVGQTNAGFSYGEGYSEPTMIRLLDGRLMVVSRVGIGRLARSLSVDLGRNWTPSPSDRISPWAKAPAILRTTGTADYVITAGGVSASDKALNPDHPAQLGIYVSSDPTAIEWSEVDLIDHHNALMDSTLRFDSLNPATGYTTILELAPNRLLINYDQAGQAYGSSTRPNRVFVVDATIERLS